MAVEPAWKPGTDAGPIAPATAQVMAAPQFRMLGPLEIRVGDAEPLDLRGERPRHLLARLLLDPGRVVSIDGLIDAVWDDHPPASAEVTLRSHVVSLRRALLAGEVDASVMTRPPGYLLRVVPHQMDTHLFERGIAEGSAALERGDARSATRALREALGLWRGRFLQDLGPPRFAEAAAARLEELRLAALEARIDADLVLGRHRELVGELETLVDIHPFREQFYGQLMLALYRSDRQAEAMDVYQLARRRLADELGLEPGPTLANMQAAILRHDPALRPGPVARTDQSATIRASDQPSATASATRLDIVRRQPMVGRTEELEHLRTLWTAVRDGAGRIAFLSGEAGVGKTRLAAEVAAGAAEGGATVLLGHCDQAAPVPYAPLTDAFQASAEVTDAWARMSAVAQHLLTNLVESPLRPPDGDRAALDDGQEGQAAFFAAVSDLLASVAHRAPTLFVVDDGEALDGASARLLRHLARHLPPRLLLLICFRDPPGSHHAPLREFLADVGHTGAADRLVLRPLPEPELAELITAWTGRPASDDVVHALWSSTGGNPFYAGAVVDELMARGGIDGTEAAWHVPTGVRDVLRERLRDLSTTAQNVVGCAAVLGREVEYGLLAKVADRPEPDVIEALEEAAAAGWLVETGQAWDAGYAFRHALMREAVHADLPALRRQRLHLRAAEAIEQSGLRRPADIASAAVHLRSSGPLGDRERAASLSLEAANAAAQLYAWDEAIAHAEAAIAILAGIDAPPAVQAGAAKRAAELLMASTLDLPRAVRRFEAALAHYRAAGDQAAVAEVRSRLGYVLSLHHSVMDIPRALEHFAASAAVLTSGEAAFDVQYGTALATIFALRTQPGLAASARAVQVARNLNQRDLVARARAIEACHVFNAGRLARADVLIDEAWNVTSEVGDPWLAWDVTTAGAMLADVYLLDPRAGRAWCDRAFAQPRFESLVLPLEGMTDQLVYALALLGDLDTAHERAGQLPDDAVSRRFLLLLDGDWEAAERSWSAALNHDLSHGDLLNAVMNACWTAQARWLLGRREEALDALRYALELCLAGPQLPGELMVRAEIARYLAAHDDVDGAATHLARCDEICATGENWRGRAGNVELARGAVAAARGEDHVADTAHRRALEVFTTYRLPWWSGETLLSWAGWQDRANRSGDAEAKRQAAREIYEELDAPERWHLRR